MPCALPSGARALRVDVPTHHGSPSSLGPADPTARRTRSDRQLRHSYFGPLREYGQECKCVKMFEFSLRLPSGSSFLESCFERGLPPLLRRAEPVFVHRAQEANGAGGVNGSRGKRHPKCRPQWEPGLRRGDRGERLGNAYSPQVSPSFMATTTGTSGRTTRMPSTIACSTSAWTTCACCCGTSTSTAS